MLRKLLRLTQKSQPLSRASVVPNPQCREFEVNNWVLSEFILREIVPVTGVMPYPLNELLLMAGAVCWVAPTHIFEWGTHVGKSARIFYETCRQFAIPAQIHSIDLPDDVAHVEHPGATRGELVRGLGGVALHQGDGLAISLDLCANAIASGDPLRPLFFLDGDHAYASVKRELEGILHAYPAAALLLHDTFFQSAASNYNIGPFQAIKDVQASLPAPKRRIDAATGLPGMTFLFS